MVFSIKHWILKQYGLLHVNVGINGLDDDQRVEKVNIQYRIITRLNLIALFINHPDNKIVITHCQYYTSVITKYCK